MMVFGGITSKASMVLLGERTAKKRGIIPTAVSGIGVDFVLKTADNFVGGPVQSFASIPVPLVGTVGVLDAINFLIFSQGGRNIRGGLTAVFAAKAAVGALPLLGTISLPNRVSGGQGSPVASGVQGADI